MQGTLDLLALADRQLGQLEDATGIQCQVTLRIVISERPLPGAEQFSPVIAVVQLQEGPRMLTNIVDVEPRPQNLPLDLPLTVAFEQRGRTAVPVFKPRERTQ